MLIAGDLVDKTNAVMETKKKRQQKQKTTKYTTSQHLILMVPYFVNFRDIFLKFRKCATCFSSLTVSVAISDLQLDQISRYDNINRNSVNKLLVNNRMRTTIIYASVCVKTHSTEDVGQVT